MNEKNQFESCMNVIRVRARECKAIMSVIDNFFKW
jgi:hypothetical protein